MASKRELLAATNLSDTPKVADNEISIIDEIMEHIPSSKKENLVKRGIYFEKYQADVIDYLSYRHNETKSATVSKLLNAGLDALYPGLRDRVIQEGRNQEFSEMQRPSDI